MNNDTRTQLPKVLVTGATGFLGGWLVAELLGKGYQVKGLKRKGASVRLLGPLAQQVEWVEGDVLDYNSLKDAMSDVQQVYHAAAVVSFDARDRAHMYKVNEFGTSNVVNLALALNIEKILHVSSVAALGRNPHKPLVDERLGWEDSSLNTHYGISKFRAECQVWRGVAEGLKAVVVNPSIILGPGTWKGNSGEIFGKVYGGLGFHPQGNASVVDVRDVARASVMLMEKPEAENQRFILNAGQQPYKELLSNIAAQMNVAAPSRPAPDWILPLAWRLEWLRSRITGQRPIITAETVRTSGHSFEYANQKVKTTLGFEFRPIEDTISFTSKRFLQTHQAGFAPIAE